ncbi:MAG: NADH-quinone oxidoreductase subunit H [Planctomycetes bacterium]|nr:NADH-quinone oxidoreductase subunit H [Planctomycetota bacterium]
MSTFLTGLHLIVALVGAPFLLSVINRTKARFAGRVGQPWLQPYFDIWKLLHKGAVYSHTTTWIFRAGPMISLAGVIVALLFVPFGGAPAVVSFQGDLILFVYFLGIARLFTVLAALDTGSAFEGMGASREVWISALAEPALMLGLAAVARELVQATKLNGEPFLNFLSLSGLHLHMTSGMWVLGGPALAMVFISLGIVVLAECSRIPVDDPTTHLELTMVHEVMVLDHGGPDFAFILYGAALKMWTLGSVLVGIILPIRTGVLFVDTLVAVAAMFCVALAIGIVEATMARLRMPRIPQLLVGALSLAALALMLDRPGGLLP